MSNPELSVSEQLGFESIPYANIEIGERMQVIYEGKEYSVHNTNNLWSYATAVMSNDNESIVGRVVGLMDLKGIFDEVQERYPHFYDVITELAYEESNVRKQLYAQPTGPEHAIAWKVFQEQHYASGEIPVLSSLLFDALVPLLQQHGRDPYEFVI
jgi:hypothetical protein